MCRGQFSLIRESVSMQVHGRDWKRLGEAVPTKTETQIKNYFQNYKQKVWHTLASLTWVS